MNSTNTKTTSFSDAMHNIKFEVRIPEYYVSTIPSYFKTGPTPPKPVLNGIEVTWEEYQEVHPEAVPDTIVPSMIFIPESDNMTIGYKSAEELVSMTLDDTPYTLMSHDALRHVIYILQGYVAEMRAINEDAVSTEPFLIKCASALKKLEDIEYATYIRHRNIYHPKQPTNSLGDLLNNMGIL